MSYYSYNAGLGLFMPDASSADAYIANNSETVIWSSNGQVSIASAPITGVSSRLAVQGGVQTDTLRLGDTTYTDTWLNANSNATYWSSNTAVSASNLANTINSTFLNRTTGGTITGPLVLGNNALTIGATNFTETNLNATATQATFASNAARFASNALPSYLPLTGGALTGNLAVGAATASATLHLGHDLYIAESSNAWSTTAGKGLYLRYSTNSNGSQDAGFIQSINRTNLQRQNLFIQASNTTFTDGVTPRLYVGENGRVGIGNSNPSYALDVSGSVNVNKSSAINNKVLVLWDGGSNDSLASATNFVGFGIGAGMLRFQVPTAPNVYKWHHGAGAATMTLSNTELTMEGTLRSTTGTLTLGTTNFTEAGLSSAVTQAASSSNAAFFASNALPSYLPLAGGTMTGNIVGNSNITSRAWVVAPQIALSQGAANLVVTNTNTYPLNGEPGNPAQSQFRGGFLNGQNDSGLTLAWNQARLLFRGCMMGTSSNASIVSAAVRVFNGSTWTTLASMTLRDNGTTSGYCTHISPLFSLGAASNASCTLGLQLLSTSTSNLSTTYRLGSATLYPVV